MAQCHAVPCDSKGEPKSGSKKASQKGRIRQSQLPLVGTQFQIRAEVQKPLRQWTERFPTTILKPFRHRAAYIVGDPAKAIQPSEHKHLVTRIYQIASYRSESILSRLPYKVGPSKLVS